MHARVTTGIALPGKMKGFVTIARDTVTKAAQQQPGFKGLQVLVDWRADKIIAVSLWETEHDMKVGEANGYYGEQIASIGYLLEGVPGRESYEVAFQV